MNLNTVFTLQAVVAFLFGLGFIFMPETLLSQYDVTANPDGITMSRFFAGAIITLGIICYFMRSEAESVTKTAVAKAFCFGNGIGVLVALNEQLTANIGPLGWSTVVLYVLFTAGYGKFAFGKA